MTQTTPSPASAPALSPSAPRPIPLSLSEALLQSDAFAIAGQHAEAEALSRSILAVLPEQPAALVQVARAMLHRNAHDEAAVILHRVLERHPEHAPAEFYLGRCACDLRNYRLGLTHFYRAVTLDPNLTQAWHWIGMTEEHRGHVDTALAAYCCAHVLQPDNTNYLWFIAFARMKQGAFTAGLKLYGQIFHTATQHKDAFPRPRWDGIPRPGAAIVIVADGGFGDIIHAMRYTRFLKQWNMQVILHCRPPVRRLLATVPYVDQVTVYGEPVPAHDVYARLHDLLPIIGTNADSITATLPAEGIYCYADPDLRRQWAARLPPFEGLSVGLVWAGDTRNPNDHLRSISLAALAPLGALRAVRFVSLQMGAAAAEAQTPPPGMLLLDPTGLITDFADTAALIANLDLVISVDTSVVHLAGALGTPVWTLLAAASDWRWLLNRDDTDWYPSMRLFRQPELHQWTPVIHRVAGELAAWIARWAAGTADAADTAAQGTLLPQGTVKDPAHDHAA